LIKQKKYDKVFSELAELKQNHEAEQKRFREEESESASKFEQEREELLRKIDEARVLV
jgi:hypothetical protein